MTFACNDSSTIQNQPESDYFIATVKQVENTICGFPIVTIPDTTNIYKVLDSLFLHTYSFPHIYHDSIFTAISLPDSLQIVNLKILIKFRKPKSEELYGVICQESFLPNEPFIIITSARRAE